MKKFTRFLSFGLVLSGLFLSSCNNDDDGPVIPEELGAYEDGMFILNEGNFGGGNASVDFLSDDGVLSHDIYSLVNLEPLGDVAQSLYLEGDLCYIVVNGSAKIEVVNRYTFEKVGTVSTGLVNPRYMTIVNGKGYVTNWGDPSNPSDDFVAVVNLSNFSVSSTIPVAEGPEQIVYANDNIYVAHMGGWGFGNTISVISPSLGSVTSTIEVEDVPSSMVVNGEFLYVLSSGKAAWTGEETVGSLTMIDTQTNITLSKEVFSLGIHPSKLTTDGNMLYYTVDDKVKAADMIDLTNTVTLFSTADQGTFGAYGMAVKDGEVFVADAGDYTSDGRVLIYTTTGTFKSVHTVGPLPNNFGFND